MDGCCIVSNASRGTCYIKPNKKEALKIKEELESLYPLVTFYIGYCDSTGFVWWERPTFPCSQKEGGGL